MRIGLMADSHDRVPAIAELVQVMTAGGVSMILHAGDFCSPFSMDPFQQSQISLAGVFGKNDGDQQGLLQRAQAGLGIEVFESPHSFDLAGHRVLLVHDIGDVHRRSIAAHSIVVHGSTHQQEMKTRGDSLIVNPGEACGWIYGSPCAAILDLDTRNVEFLSLDSTLWTR